MLSRVCALLAMVVAAFASTAPAGADQPNWPPLVIIATASPGGTYHAYGQGLAKLLTRVLDLPVVEQTTEGPRENIQLIEAGDVQLGFVTMGVALQAWNGTGDWTNGKQYREIRALFPMYDTPFHFVVLKDSNIRSLADMAGKRVGAGPETGTAGIYVPRFLSTLKINATLSYGTWDDLAAQLEEGTVDVLAVAAGVPFPAVAGLEAKNKIRYVAPTQEETVVLRLAIPELTASVIPPGSYPSLMTPYQTVGLYNFAVADKDLPSDLVYRIVDAVFAQHQEMIDIHPAAAATVPANFVHNTFLPYHPGALRYYGNVAATGVVRAD
jgi:TRAP transporter TAXI family solute receptor